MQADRYSQLVGWLKVLLPLMALALLSTLFLLSRVVDPEGVIPFADKEIQDRLRDQQVTGPIYYAVTADGDEISFAAEKLTTPQGKTGGNEVQDVEVVMDLASGSNIVLNAQMAHISIETDNADLRSDVVIKTSNGYRIESDRLITQMSTLNVNSPGPVAADGPIGTLNAGAMLLNAGKGGEAAQLVFTNGVKLVYIPQQDIE
jgi:lipopolysaccharide export system protein LptC